MKSLIQEVKDFFIRLAILIGIGLVILFLFAILLNLPPGSLAAQIVGGLLIIIVIVIVIFVLIVSPEAAAGLLEWVLREHWQGFLLLLLFAGIAFIVWMLGKRIWKWKKRKEAATWELEDRLKELEEQLSLGIITQGEYEEKKKDLLEKSKA